MISLQDFIANTQARQASSTYKHANNFMPATSPYLTALKPNLNGNGSDLDPVTLRNDVFKRLVEFLAGGQY